MTAELGTATDPKALIPGEVATVEGIAQQMQTYGDALREAGAGLGRVDTAEGWHGSAAERFQENLHGQPLRWLHAGDAFHDAARALRSYTVVLGWAQEQAREAIRLWQAGSAATAAASTGDSQSGPAPTGPAPDPGAEQRAQAETLLARAREQLDTEGHRSTEAMGKACAQAPQAPGFWDSVGAAASTVGNGLVNIGTNAVNSLASAGNAALSHPAQVAAGAAGTALAAASLGGEGIGLGLDATGAGAAAGVPLNAVSAAGVATGASMAGAAAMSIGQHAAGDDHVEPVQQQQGSSSKPEGDPPGVQDGWQARQADNGKGTVYQDPNADGNANMVRVMDPTERYSHGYVRFYNDNGQPVGLDGKPGPKPHTHIPIRPNGSYPAPEGW